MADNKGVMVYGEAANGKLAAITMELLGCGRKLANDLGQELSVVLVGSGVGALAKDAFAYGADKVYVVDDPVLKDYQNATFVAAMEKVAKQVNPVILLIGQTNTGRDLAPRLAFRMKTGIATDCLELTIDPKSKQLLATRPVYGGNARATFVSKTMPQIVTVRAKAMAALSPDASKKGEVVNIAAGIDPATVKTKVVDRVKEEVTGIKLEEAPVIVCGGRGIGGPEGFKQLQELAALLKGTIGGSRPPCDSGWLPESLQVGLTGKIVSPDLYIAVAVSGASQHMSGCSGAKTIVAINKDPEANIFREARFGVIGDWKKVVPALTAKIKEITSK